MNTRTFPPFSKNFIIPIAVLALALSSLACTMQKRLVYFLVPLSAGADDDYKEEWAFDEFGVETSEDDLVAENGSESVLSESESYGSEGDSSPGNPPQAASVPDPVSEECVEAGYCTAAYPVDIRVTTNPPDVIVFANAAEYPSPSGFSVTYTESAGPWYEWLVLKEPGDWAQAASPTGYSALGIQFWGDQTNGWAQVTLDGVEVWRGDVTAFGTDGVNYFVFVEITGIDAGPHTLRAEVLGQPGKAGGDNVPVFYFAYRE